METERKLHHRQMDCGTELCRIHGLLTHTHAHTDRIPDTCRNFPCHHCPCCTSISSPLQQAGRLCASVAARQLEDWGSPPSLLYLFPLNLLSMVNKPSCPRKNDKPATVSQAASPLPTSDDPGKKHRVPAPQCCEYADSTVQKIHCDTADPINKGQRTSSKSISSSSPDSVTNSPFGKFSENLQTQEKNAMMLLTTPLNYGLKCIKIKKVMPLK